MSTFDGVPVQLWHTPSDEHLTSLGRVAFFAGLLEEAALQLTKLLVAGVADDEHRARIATEMVSREAFTRLIQLSRRLLPLVADEVTSELNDLANAGARMTQRNDVLHAFWVEQPHDATMLESVVRKRGKPASVRQTTIAALDELSADLGRTLWWYDVNGGSTIQCRTNPPF